MRQSGLSVAALLVTLAAGAAAEDRVGPGVREFCADLRAAQQGLRTARARCELDEMVTLLNRTFSTEGTVTWRRMPDGSVRQRWDLEEPGPDGEAHPVTLLVSGGEIVRMQEGKVVERGPLRSAEVFHHPVFGGLVFDVPTEEALKDPEFTITADDEEREPSEAHAAPSGGPGARRHPDADGDGTDGADGRGAGRTLYLIPRRAPWTELLRGVQITLDAGNRRIARARYEETNGNRSFVRFRDFEANPAIDEHFFDPPVEPAEEKAK